MSTASAGDCEEPGSGLQVFSKARRIVSGCGEQPRALRAERSRQIAPQAFGEAIDVPFMSFRPSPVHCGTGAMAPPGAENATPTAPSNVGPRLLQEYWRRGEGDRQPVRAPNGATAAGTHLETFVERFPARVARRRQLRADVGPDAQDALGRAPGGAHRGEGRAGIPGTRDEDDAVLVDELPRELDEPPFVRHVGRL